MRPTTPITPWSCYAERRWPRVCTRWRKNRCFTEITARRSRRRAVLAMMYWLGLKASYSRPRVSDDNAFSESLFRTAKYRPEFPAKGFADLQEARLWARSFVHWYNNDHKHSGIRYVSPAQRHAGEDRDDPRRSAWGVRSGEERLTRDAGRVIHATGIRSPSSRSIPSATR